MSFEELRKRRKKKVRKGMQDFFSDSFDMPSGNFTSYSSHSIVTVTRNGKTVHLTGDEAREMNKEFNEN